MSEPKPKHLVIDTSVYINYTRHQKLYRLVDAILTYDLAVYISSELLDELERNISLTSAFDLPQFVYDGYLRPSRSNEWLSNAYKLTKSQPTANFYKVRCSVWNFRSHCRHVCV